MRSVDALSRKEDIFANNHIMKKAHQYNNPTRFSRLKLEDQEFKITGVNHYKIALEYKIEEHKRKLKDLERSNHYAEVAEKRMSKEVNEKIVFI